LRGAWRCRRQDSLKLQGRVAESRMRGRPHLFLVDLRGVSRVVSCACCAPTPVTWLTRGAGAGVEKEVLSHS